MLDDLLPGLARHLLEAAGARITGHDVPHRDVVHRIDAHQHAPPRQIMNETVISRSTKAGR